MVTGYEITESMDCGLSFTRDKSSRHNDKVNPDNVNRIVFKHLFVKEFMYKITDVFMVFISWPYK